MSSLPFEAILFDCDGVLVDSEPLVNEVLVEILGEMGWHLSLPEAIRLFTGKMVRDQAILIQEKTGIVIDQAWEQAFRARRDQRLEARLTVIPGAVETVAQIHREMAGRMAVASGADIGKVRMQLHKTGLASYFGEQVFSGQDQAANKPAPDVYLHAASRLGARAQCCAVIEDSVTGVRAGAAAGATVFAYFPPGSRHTSAQALLQAGAAVLFSRMEDLPPLLHKPG
ncbi:HAD family hydrolase [Frateuria aurantia]